MSDAPIVEIACAAWWDAARGTTDGSLFHALNVVDRANSITRMRAAFRAAAYQFADPVVKNALLWAAKEGEGSNG